MSGPVSLMRDISPPPLRKDPAAQTRRSMIGNINTALDEAAPGEGTANGNDASELEPTHAAVEAGKAQVRDHLSYFSEHFDVVRRPSPQPTISIDAFRALYQRNQHSQGRHFVVHQHDHPVSGVHYDLRLQFSETSTISFAIPYGLPGNPNSIRPNRMAIETRVHTLWNNLVESASHATGSLFIWDTGEYEVLERPRKKARTTDDEMSELSDTEHQPKASQSERLATAFRSRHIHLRLNGTRLPQDYTIALRLPSNNNTKGQPRKPDSRRRRKDPPNKVAKSKKTRAVNVPSDTDSDSEPTADQEPDPTSTADSAEDDPAIASDPESQDQDAAIRTNNAYPGATNTINSIHQRKWFLSLDRKYSGFRKARTGPDTGRWIEGWGEPFFVQGREYERSVVTGRLAGQVMEDEGVEGYVGREGWRGVME